MSEPTKAMNSFASRDSEARRSRQEIGGDDSVT